MPSSNLLFNFQDKTNNDSQLNEKYINIIKAYEILSNEDSRKEYDRELEFKKGGSIFNFSSSGSNLFQNEAFTFKFESYDEVLKKYNLNQNKDIHNYQRNETKTKLNNSNLFGDKNFKY